MKKWISTKGGRELLEILLKFSDIRRLKIEIDWKEEEKEEEIIEKIEISTSSYPKLELLDLSDCRLTDQQLLGILEGLQDISNLKILKVRGNYFRPEIIEKIRERARELETLEIEESEYLPISIATSWNSNSSLYQKYYKTMIGHKKEYDELMAMSEGGDSLVLSYCILPLLNRGDTVNMLIQARKINLDQLRDRATMGDPEIQCNLGAILYCLADFIPQGPTEYMQEGYRWCRKAAAMGFTEAEIILSFYNQVNSDMAAAIKHCERAGEKGHGVGFCRLGTSLYPQQITSVLDEEQRMIIGQKIFDCAEKAAELDHVDAQMWVARNCEAVNGLSTLDHENRVIKNKMLKWYKRAAENGHEGARLKFQQLSEESTAH